MKVKQNVIENSFDKKNQESIVVQKTQKAGFLRKKSTYIVLGIIVIAIIAFLIIRRGGSKTEYVTEVVERSNLEQTVSATGKVDADNQVDLTFNVLGEIDELLVEVGDDVLKGDLLATLKNDSLRNRIQEAQAFVAAQKANLQKVYEGAKDEEVVIANNKVKRAEITLANAKRDYDALATKLNSDISAFDIEVANLTQSLADTKVTNALNITNTQSNLLISLSQSHVQSENAIDRVNEIINDSSINNTFSAGDGVVDTNTASSLDRLPALVSTARSTFATAQASQTNQDITIAHIAASELLNEVEYLLDNMLQGLFATPETFTNSTNLSTWKADIRTHITANNTSQADVETKYQLWNSAIVNEPILNNQAQFSLDTAESRLITGKANNTVQLASAQANIDNAKILLDLAKSQLALTTSKATSSDIALAQANVAQAQAAVNQLNSQLANYQLVAPFDSVVAKINVDENESVLATTSSVLTLIGDEKYYITVDISESDITKIKLNDVAEVTLDSYGDDVVFNGTVTQIDPAETVIQDVVYYKVDLAFDVIDGHTVKQGMTANVDVKTAERDGVITVPSRAVLRSDNGRRYVRLLNDNNAIDTTVTVGLRGDQGRLEILSGLAEGDVVIVFEKSLD